MTYDVVVVDDTSDLRYLLKILLEMNDQFRVVGEASDGVQAIDAVAEHTPDLVLLDVAMPVLDGLQALPRIREVSPLSCVVMLSGYPSVTAEKSAREAGAFAYLEKERLTELFIPRLLAVMQAFIGTQAPR